MLKIDRHAYILEEIKKNHLVRVTRLARVLNVTEMTVRRDLKELEDFGQVVRVHGGAKQKPKTFYQEDNYNKKININIDEKREIAKKAASIIKDNETIFIGAGSTTSYLHEFIEGKTLNIITNSIIVFNQFKDTANCDLIFVGGRYREKTKGFIGYFTQEVLSKISVNKAFIGVNGIDLEALTISDEEEGRCNATILDNSTEKYVLADHTKFAAHAFYSFYEVKELTGVITDSKLDEAIKEQYKKTLKVV